jgi:hypothetical protein
MNRAEINPARINRDKISPDKINPTKMNPERWREIKPLLESALELEAGDRRAFLDEACAGDASLRLEVESFIAAHEQAGYFYVLNEGPERVNELPDFNTIFPSDGDSALVAANKQIQIPLPSKKTDEDWIEFQNGEKGMEKIWLIWSGRRMEELESIKYLANRKYQGRITNPVQIKHMDSYLKALAKTKIDVKKDEQSGLMKFKGEGEVLAGVVRLEHR